MRLHTIFEDQQLEVEPGAGEQDIFSGIMSRSSEEQKKMNKMKLKNTDHVNEQESSYNSEHGKGKINGKNENNHAGQRVPGHPWIVKPKSPDLHLGEDSKSNTRKRTLAEVNAIQDQVNLELQHAQGDEYGGQLMLGGRSIMYGPPPLDGGKLGPFFGYQHGPAEQKGPRLTMLQHDYFYDGPSPFPVRGKPLPKEGRLQIPGKGNNVKGGIPPPPVGPLTIEMNGSCTTSRPKIVGSLGKAVPYYKNSSAATPTSSLTVGAGTNTTTSRTCSSSTSTGVPSFSSPALSGMPSSSASSSTSCFDEKLDPSSTADEGQIFGCGLTPGLQDTDAMASLTVVDNQVDPCPSLDEQTDSSSKKSCGNFNRLSSPSSSAPAVDVSSSATPAPCLSAVVGKRAADSVSPGGLHLQVEVAQKRQKIGDSHEQTAADIRQTMDHKLAMLHLNERQLDHSYQIYRAAAQKHSDDLIEGEKVRRQLEQELRFLKAELRKHETKSAELQQGA
ncbi:unnamed protein product [Amoebophrya sp. A25]|nr:unnamed protein product [Amoebophrya sp. A25]|eukprot:GSA25T00010595001.1